MKKFLAITFAVAMIMSVAGASFAAEPQGCGKPPKYCKRPPD
ncbi:hypothetical protein [Brevibacillus daliensis]|nr:hypothetical protein [Brevibacillus daliensis]